uniref:NELL2-interacting cell ontogeny regulator 1 n=1 Tax=Mandrillus leucophaeus TaxID=9568 RepID=A0A2K5YLS4_MANLE
MQCTPEARPGPRSPASAQPGGGSSGHGHASPAHRPSPAQGQDTASRLGRGGSDPARSSPCVDCHAFEFMQRALQDLRKTACSLDARMETLLLQAERRALCACWPAGR